MEYNREELEQMLDMIQQKIAEQAPYFDARLCDKERNIKQMITNLDTVSKNNGE